MGNQVLPEIVKLVVEALTIVKGAETVEEAWEMKPLWKVWSAVHVFADERRDAEVERQVPETEKHPAEILKPFAAVEVALVEVRLSTLAWSPPERMVEVPRLVTRRELMVVEPAWRPKYKVEVAEATKLPTFCTESMEPGVEVPTPRKPPLVMRAASVKVPDLRVAKARSPFACCGTPPVPPWNTLKTEAVVVPVLCTMSSVLKARETLVDEVAEP